MSEIKCRSGYLDDVLTGPDALSNTVTGVMKCLAKLTDKFDAIAFRGMSGALVAPAVSMHLKKYLVMIRKTGEDCHSSSVIEGAVDGKFRYIIIDDQVDSGHTVHTIQQTIWQKNPIAKCVGICLYRYSASWHDPKEWRTGDPKIWFRPDSTLTPEPESVFIDQSPITEPTYTDFAKDYIIQSSMTKLLPAP